ncbi:hypothetical protein [Streptomyces sp. NPDC040750]|uniref:hypothetical protein n=1 Tax=Streptomyces sp. NPDC040750 TaxID=3154491 RepID=UPI0033D21B74
MADAVGEEAGSGGGWRMQWVHGLPACVGQRDVFGAQDPQAQWRMRAQAIPAQHHHERADRELRDVVAG